MVTYHFRLLLELKNEKEWIEYFTFLFLFLIGFTLMNYEVHSTEMKFYVQIDEMSIPFEMFNSADLTISFKCIPHILK